MQVVPASSDAFTENRLLRSLRSEDVRGLVADFELLPDVELRHSVYSVGESVDFVYFPLNCVFSLLSEIDDGRAVEIATVGNEGFVGVPLFLQGGATNAHSAFCQVPGASLRMPAAHFSQHVARLPALHGILHRYTLALLTQIGQSSACNRLHTLQQRCARWILMTHDRVGRDEFTLTQEFLAQMLGVRRSGVNEVAQEFRERGFIRYTRGQLTITDRPGMEGVVCKCYGVIRSEHERLSGG